MLLNNFNSLEKEVKSDITNLRNAKSCHIILTNYFSPNTNKDKEEHLAFVYSMECKTS